MKTPSLKFDFDFFRRHCERTRFYRDNEAPCLVGDALLNFYGKEAEAKRHYEILMAPAEPLDFTSPSIVRCKGAYYKGGESIVSLKTCLNTNLPEDFVQFYGQFGEAIVFTRNLPVWIQSVEPMIQGFEDCLAAC